MERLHQVAELVERPERTRPVGVGGMWREERDRLVAPVVGPAGWRRQRIELEDRQQLDGGDPEIDEVRDLLHEAGVGAAQIGRHARPRIGGHPGQVRLIDHRLAPRPGERLVAIPVVVAGIGHDALHRGGHRVGHPGRDTAVAAGHGDATPVRVEQDLVRVEAEAILGRPRPVRGVAVELAGHDTRDVRVPVLARPVDVRVEANDPGRDEVVGAIEEQDVDAGRTFGIDPEIDARRRHRGTQRVGRPGLDRGRRMEARQRPSRLIIGARRRRHRPYSPTLACIIPPSATNVVAVL